MPGDLPQEKRWPDLRDHVNKWFHKPDDEALLVALCAGVAHYWSGEAPVWLFVEGGSSSGKTAIIIESLRCLPTARIMGSLTENTFLSGYGKGKKGKEFSLLHEIGASGLLLFKDFTTFLSRRKETKIEIASQLREIYDGEFYKDTGGSKQLLWAGKITIIAAVTHAIEREWLLMRDMGERFLTVRWPRGDGREQARRARTQRKHLQEIKDGIREKTLAFVDHTNLKSASFENDEDAEILDNLCDIVAVLRSSVQWDWRTKKIESVTEPEGTGRLSLALTNMACASASLFRREYVTDADQKLVRRVGMDSVPKARESVFRYLLTEPAGSSLKEISKATKIFYAEILKATQELAALGVLELDMESMPFAEVRPYFKTLAGKAGLDNKEKT